MSRKCESLLKGCILHYHHHSSETPFEHSNFSKSAQEAGLRRTCSGPNVVTGTLWAKTKRSYDPDTRCCAMPIRFTSRLQLDLARNTCNGPHG